MSSRKPWKCIIWLLEIWSSHSRDYALTVFYDVTQHSAVDMYQYFWRTCWPHLLAWRWSSMVHWKTSTYLPHFTSDSRGQVINNDYCQSFTFIKKLISKENENTNWFLNKVKLFLISNFRHVLNVVCFLLGYSPASEFCVPMFQNTLSVPSS